MPVLITAMDLAHFWNAQFRIELAKTGIDAEFFKPGFAGIILLRQDNMPTKGLRCAMQGFMKNGIGEFDIVWIKAENEVDERRIFWRENGAAEPSDAFGHFLIVEVVHADRKATSVNSPDGVADSGDLKMIQIKGNACTKHILYPFLQSNRMPDHAIVCRNRTQPPEARQ